jgi:hypothetical protein
MYIWSKEINNFDVFDVFSGHMVAQLCELLVSLVFAQVRVNFYLEG